MDITIPELAILVSLGLLSISISINAKGPVRTTFSYAITVLILFIAATIGFLGINSIESPIQSLSGFGASSLDEFPSPPAEMASLDTEQPQTQVQVQAKSKLKIPVRDEIQEQFIKESQKVLRKSLSLASQLSNFDFGDPAAMTDEQYETIRQKASSLNSRTSAALRMANGLQAANNQKRAKLSLVKAIQTLKVASKSAQGFFNAESSTQESQLAKATNSMGQSALLKLSKLKPILK